MQPSPLRQSLETRHGATRFVVLIGNWAIKLPLFLSWRSFLNGLLGNMQEKQFGSAGWDGLCPVLIADPLGFFVVMPRAIPLTETEYESFEFENFVERGTHRLPIEPKPDSFGWLNGEIVGIDYGN